MAPQRPTSRSILTRDYVIAGPNTKVVKKDHKLQHGSRSKLTYRNGLLNPSIPVRSKSMKIAKRNSATSPLLRLPGEIRNKIWEYTMGYHHIDIGNRSCKREWPIGPRLDIRPLYPAKHFPRIWVRPTFALGQVCRQTYVESSSYIYTLNTFKFDSCATFDTWFGKRPVGQQRLVTSVNVPYDYMRLYWHGFRKSFIKKLPNIQRIGIDDNIPRFSRKSEADTVEMARARIVELIQAKEGNNLEIDWH